MSVTKNPMVACAKAHGMKAKAGPFVWLVGSLYIASVITGCGSKSDKKDSQVAAQVNDKEITIHQVNKDRKSVV